MKPVDKKIWEKAIVAEDAGWSFENKSIYAEHDIACKHGQIVCFAKYMELFEDFAPNKTIADLLNYSEKGFDLKQKTIVDICGGPVSLLLRCYNFKRAIVVDPGNFPDYIVNRYKKNNIEVASVPAEEYIYPDKVDEVWMYNALTHVYDPFKILVNAKNKATTLRIVESLNTNINIQHPQSLTREGFEDTLGVKGKVYDMNEPAPSPRGEHLVMVIRNE